MEPAEIRMHLAAGRSYGKESTCLNYRTGKPKMAYVSEETAVRHAESLTRKSPEWPKEAYPCFFCSERFPDQVNDFVTLKWHVGREMSVQERELFLGKLADTILEMEDVTINVADTHGFQKGEQNLRVHNRKLCEGQNCSIHNPSDHHMVTWPLNWRGDRRIMERICPHGVGHIDPDDDKFRRNRDGENYDSGVHGCDGCCFKPGGLSEKLFKE